MHFFIVSPEITYCMSYLEENMKLNYSFISVTIIALLIVGCFDNNSAINEANEPSNKELSTPQAEAAANDEVVLIWHNATVRYFEFEGGFYGLVTEDGQKLLPMNLSEKYQHDGTKVKVQGDLVKDIMSLHQWGELFNINEIEIVKQ